MYSPRAVFIKEVTDHLVQREAIRAPIGFSDLRRLVTGVRSRDLALRDAAVYCAVMVHASPVTGVAGVGATRIAELIDMQRPHVAASLKRLVEVGVLVKERLPRSNEARYKAPCFAIGSDESEEPW